MNKNLEKGLFVGNFLLFRIDSFFQNIVDFVYIVIFYIILLKYTYGIMGNFIFALVTPIVAHLLYSIIYIVNDYFSFYKDITNKESYFYKFRPLVFLKSKVYVIPWLLIYFLWLFIISMLYYNIFNESFILFLIISLGFTSSLHSRSNGILRVLCFFLLRIQKYILLLCLFNLVLSYISLNNKLIFFTMFFSLILPYSLHWTLTYGMKKRVLKIDNLQKYSIFIFFVSNVSLLLYTFIFTYQTNLFNFLYFLLGIIYSHLLTTLPFFIYAYLILYKIIRQHKEHDFISYIKGVIISSLFTIIWALIVFFLILPPL